MARNVMKSYEGSINRGSSHASLVVPTKAKSTSLKWLYYWGRDTESNYMLTHGVDTFIWKRITSHKEVSIMSGTGLCSTGSGEVEMLGEFEVGFESNPARFA